MNYSAEVYYEGDHRDHPVIVRGDDDIDALIDVLLASPFHNSMATLQVIERPRRGGRPDHEFGVAVDAEGGVGGPWYLDSAEGAWYTLGQHSEREEVFYCFVGNARDFPIDSEIPLGLLRQAAKEFLASGGRRPTWTRWTRRSVALQLFAGQRRVLLGQFPQDPGVLVVPTPVDDLNGPDVDGGVGDEGGG